MVEGVTKGYEKLKIEGIGYQASAKNKGVELTVGYANRVLMVPPDGVTVEVPDQTTIVIKGGGQAESRSVRGRGTARSAAGTVQRQGHPLRERTSPPQGRQVLLQWRLSEATMNYQKAKQVRRLRRRNHVRRKITGTVERPRLTVFRSSKHIYAQSDRRSQWPNAGGGEQRDAGVQQGFALRGQYQGGPGGRQTLAEVAKEQGITKAAFDRGHYRFHGRVKALAEAANAAGCCAVTNPAKKNAAAPEADLAEDSAEKRKRNGQSDRRAGSASDGVMYSVAGLRLAWLRGKLTHLSEKCNMARDANRGRTGWKIES